NPPLLPSEDPDAYDRLLTGVGVAGGTEDVIEWLWVKDFVDLLWEAQRLRRLRAALLTGVRRQALDDLLRLHGEPDEQLFDLGLERQALPKTWRSGAPKGGK